MSFDGGGSNTWTANHLCFLQGPKELITEPGEWSLEHADGMLYYWPRNQAAMETGEAEIVAATTKRVLDIRGDGWAVEQRATAIDFIGIVFSGSDFSPEYGIFTSGYRQNDTPVKYREGLVRIENASDVTVTDCAVLDAGHSAFWLQGFVQNVTITGNWIERPGFCGAYLNGIYPGDTTSECIGNVTGGPIKSAAESDVNFGHVFSDNLIFDYGRRVGHASGLWFFQAGRSRVTRNLIQEGPRDAIGVYGVRYGGGVGSSNPSSGTLPHSLYGQQLDFWKALEVLHTRFIEIDHNEVRNAVRDTSDAGALEFWGVGVSNTAHHNCFSDMDSSILDGGWMNFLFQDDAAHYVNFSSNIVYEMKGVGAQEAGMMKSIGSVFENSIIADSVLGNLFAFTPYVEPAANMIYRRNIHAHLTSTNASSLQMLTNNGFESATLLNSTGPKTTWKGYGFENGPPFGYPPLALTDKVIKEFDSNSYFDVRGFNVSLQQAHGWDVNSSLADPQFMRTRTSQPWNRTCDDYMPAPTSPVWGQGFRPIDATTIGLSDRFQWDRAAIGRQNAAQKIQAELYQRMHGLWRLGSYFISGSHTKTACFGSSLQCTAVYHFSTQAWARHDNVDIDCPAPCTLTVRFKSDTNDPLAHRRIRLAVDAPLDNAVVATLRAPPTPAWTLLNTSLAVGGLTARGATLFLLLDGVCDIDYFYLRTSHGNSGLKTDDNVYPWPWLHGGTFSQPTRAASIDPLVQYVWPTHTDTSKLQLFNVSAKAIVADRPSSFGGLSATGGPITVEGEGCLFLDFGEENAGWLEFDAKGLPAAKDVLMSISEYNEPDILNSGTKTAPATKLPLPGGGQGYRLVLNPLLYEGVRFGWICVRNFTTAWTLTDIRLVVQAKPQSYVGSFSSSEALLDRVWYTGAYVVRANLGPANFGSILIDRGDRTVWAGDAHPAQAAALVAFGNYDFVNKSLVTTGTNSGCVACPDCGIETYNAYWMLSVCDYVRYSSDTGALLAFADNIDAKLDHAAVILQRIANGTMRMGSMNSTQTMNFAGWDERLGAGFEDPDQVEVHRLYKALIIRCANEAGKLLQPLGHPFSKKWLEQARLLSQNLGDVTKWGLHSVSDLINADATMETSFLSSADKATIAATRFNASAQICSFSPFNGYFLLQALGNLGLAEAALFSILHCWGGMIELGGSMFWEIFRYIIVSKLARPSIHSSTYIH